MVQKRNRRGENFLPLTRACTRTQGDKEEEERAVEMKVEEEGE